MQIQINYLLNGAKRAKGLIVIIDVMRAFTTSAFILNNGAEAIIPVEHVKDAFILKKKNPKFVLAGERGGLKYRGFDLGNSPYDANKIDFTGKTVILTTSSGTRGLMNANGSEIMVGSFVVASATIKYIKSLDPKLVTLVAMGGRNANVRRAEDDLYAEYIRDRLNGKSVDFTKMRKHIEKTPKMKKFFLDTDFVKDDLSYAMELDKFDFCMKVYFENNNRIIRKLDI